MKKQLYLFLGVLVISCGNKTIEDKNTINVLSSGITGGRDAQEQALFTEKLEQATGLSIKWEYADSYDRALQQKLGAGEEYDLIYLKQDQMYNLIKQDVLLDISPFIDNSTIIKENVDPIELSKIGYQDKYYALFHKFEIFPLININKAITDKLEINLDDLDSLDSYYQMMKQVKIYMESTGGKKVFYPLFIYIANIWDLQPWFSSVGLRRGLYLDPQGKKNIPWLTTEAKPVWEWLAKLYKEGLLDPESFTGKTSNMRSKLWQSQSIVLNSDWAAWTGIYNNNAKIAGTYPHEVNIVGLPGTKSLDGKYLLEQGNASLWAIPINANNPEGGFKLIEYLSTPEGGLLLTAGIEGYDYNIENGKIVYTEIGNRHAKDHGAPFPISTKFDLSILGEANPGLMESYRIGQRDDVLVAPLGFAEGALNTTVFYEIMSRWMSEAILGKTSIDQSMENARDELRQKKVID